MRSDELRRAASRAYQVLVNQQITSLPVDPLAMLRHCRDTVVMTYAEAAETLGIPPADFERQFGDMDAFTLRRDTPAGRQYMVMYRADGNPARLRFTLAHELGHRLLNHEGADPQEERAADCFASHLLCPRPVIARLAARFQPLYAEQVAAVCYVSLSCARTLATSPYIFIEDSLTEKVEEQLGAFADSVEPVADQGMRHIIRTAESC